jgi:hypothetical protein
MVMAVAIGGLVKNQGTQRPAGMKEEPSCSIRYSWASMETVNPPISK